MSVRRELASGVFYTSIAKYAGIVVTLVVTGILSRLFTPEQFGVVNIATVVIAFFAIFSDLGIGPAVIQHKDLDRHDLGGIFSLSVWSGAVMALLFFAAAGTIASLYGDSQVLRNVLRILALNLFFAAANIVPNALILKEKRFRVRRHAVAHGANRRGHGCHRRSLCRGRHLRTDDQPGVFEPDAPGDKLPPEPAAAAPAPGTQGAGQSILVLGLPVLVPVDKLFQPQPRQAAHGTLHEPLATGLLRQVVPG